jgi:hypothetical protein
MKARLAIWLDLFLFLGAVTFTTAFLVGGPEIVEYKKIFRFFRTHYVPDQRVFTARLSAGSSDNDDNAHDNDYYDDEIDQTAQTAYGNRSLAWTNKYRKLFPYENARATAMSLGLRRKEEWDEYLSDGKCYGAYLPSRPDEMYRDDWVSWEEFLGIMRDYIETQHIVQYVLQLQNIDEYKAFVKADPKRAEGLRIPAIPNIVYKGKGWDSFDSFFGTTTKH